MIAKTSKKWITLPRLNTKKPRTHPIRRIAKFCLPGLLEIAYHCVKTTCAVDVAFNSFKL